MEEFHLNLSGMQVKTEEFHLDLSGMQVKMEEFHLDLSGMQVKMEEFHLDLHTRRPLTQSNYTRCCINTIILVRMST